MNIYVLRKGRVLKMIQKKDVKSLIGWSATAATIATVVFQNAISVTMLSREKSSEYRGQDFSESAESKVLTFGAISTLIGAFTASFMGSRHGASMKNKYEQENLQNSVSKVTSIIGGVMGVINAVGCAITGQNVSHVRFGEVFTDDDREMKFTNTFDLKDFAIKSAFNTMIMVAIGYYVSYAYSELLQLDVEPLSIETLEKEGRFGLETLDKKNKICLEKALKDIKNAKGDVFKALEKYNKVYSRKFTTVGTPIEMAKRENNKGLVKELVKKNNELILSGLYCVRNAKLKTLEM